MTGDRNEESDLPQDFQRVRKMACKNMQKQVDKSFHLRFGRLVLGLDKLHRLYKVREGARLETAFENLKKFESCEMQGSDNGNFRLSQAKMEPSLRNIVIRRADHMNEVTP